MPIWAGRDDRVAAFGAARYVVGALVISSD
jgi:hypothetical protein